MQRSQVNDVIVYNLSGQKTLPQWLSDKQKRRLLKSDDELRRRIELIQDFTMPDVAHCVTMSPDARYILAGGTYKPRIRCYDVGELSMKFERCLDADVHKILALSDGFEKLALLEDERYIEMHTQSGRYFRIRIPKYGRDMLYHEPNAELMICASGCTVLFIMLTTLLSCSRQIYRLNLDIGRFMQPLESEALSTTCCAVNPRHHLFVNGTVDCRIETWDMRCAERVGILDCLSDDLLHDELQSNFAAPQVTAVAWKGDDMHMAVGTSYGECRLYDIRTKRPLLIKRTHNEMPIKRVQYLSSGLMVGDADEEEDISALSSGGTEQLVATMDTRSLKFWRERDGRPVTSIEPDVPLNDVHFVRDSGIMLVATESPQLHTYYMPALGAAPRWCTFLDNITEELDEKKNADENHVYDDYKFVTREQLNEIGMENLIGTALLRPYMHGYFVDVKLWSHALDMTRSAKSDDYRQRRIRDKLEGQRAMRAVEDAITRRLPPVNKKLAQRLITEEESFEQAQSKGKLPLKTRTKAKNASAILHDDRFSALFKNPDFEIDEDDIEYKLTHPSRVAAAMKNAVVAEEQEAVAEEQEVEGGEHSGDETDEMSEAEAFLHTSEEAHKKTREREDKLKRIAGRRRRAERRQERMAALKEDFRALIDNTASSSTGGVKTTFVSDDHDKASSSHYADEVRDSESALSVAERAEKAGRKSVKSSHTKDIIEREGDGVQITFQAGTSELDERRALKKQQHKLERKKVRRSAHQLQLMKRKRL